MFKAKNIHPSILIAISVHTAIWLLILHMEFNLLGIYESFVITFIEGTKFIDEAYLIIPTLVALFYWNSYYLVPNYLNRKSWWLYLITLVLSFLAAIFLGFILFEYFSVKGYQSGIYDGIDFFDHSLVIHLIVVGISTSLGISKISMENAKQKKEALEKQKEAELKYLQAQVSPHFLFNTLNTIYSLANDEGSPKTTDAVLKLSKMMRYVLKESAQQKVSLQNEIAFLQNFIELQLLRLLDNVPVQFRIIGEVTTQNIAPLLLITFVENTFKHGISYQQPSPIFIELNIKDSSINLITKNAINKKNNSIKSGIGLENVRKRLAHLYPNGHELLIEQNDHNFEVNLNIEL